MPKANYTGATLASLCDTLALIMWEPRSVHQLAAVCGRQEETLRWHARALHDAGLIRIADWTPRGAPIYAHQARPFDQPDAARAESPDGKEPRNAHRPEPRATRRGVSA